ncbi:HTH-type transcriptional regulator LrpC [Clostridium sp. N3C]|uniref:Lrp/AsnC family transcriptional regulator n=1 Tax=Clostridium sp. N3C TaxID=1776758 RepID=UPI00092E00DB|nr:Lrp/AsnC family transcriptional regulator [Clostridium sp. N3C]SCN24469.1 HTH-type transcriptional regulator LrpC [Clostridium sp. N3C]
MKNDKIDVLILKELQKDSRLSIRELSKRINLSPPSVSERVRKLEDYGIIEGYSIKINKKKIGLSIDCIIKVTMKNGEYEKFKTFIKDYERSEWCYRIAGNGCFLVKLSVESLEEIEEFINHISSYALTETTIAFSEVPIDNSIDKFIEKANSK